MNARSMLTAALLAAALLAAHPALAADPPAAAELAHLVVPKAWWSAWVEGLAQETQARLQSHPGQQLQYPADFQKTVRAEVEKAFPYEEMVALSTKELAAAYTEAELKEVLGFMKTPVGQKWVKTSGETAAKANTAMDQNLRARMPEIMTRLSKLAKPPAQPQKKADPAPAKK